MLLVEQIYSLRNPSGKPDLRNSEIKASVILYIAWQEIVYAAIIVLLCFFED